MRPYTVLDCDVLVLDQLAAFDLAALRRAREQRDDELIRRDLQQVGQKWPVKNGTIGAGAAASGRDRPAASAAPSEV